METGPAISDLDALDALDASATLAAVEDSLVARRRAEARDLALAAHWADLHAADPQLGPGGRREWCGEDRLIDVGGDGTPPVQELCLVELAISRRVHPHASRRLVADLDHRLHPHGIAGADPGDHVPQPELVGPRPRAGARQPGHPPAR